MDYGNDWKIALIAAISGGGLAKLLSVVVNYLNNNKQIKITDEASLRSALMEERKQLVTEIQQLSARCDNLEVENHELREEITNMQKDHYEKERIMQIELDMLRQQVTKLAQELSIYKNGIN